MWDGTPATDVLRAVNGEHDVRLLRRLDVREGETGVGGRIDTVIGVVVDCETTGIGDDDVIIDFALRRFRADPEGVIVKIDRAYSWLEDPGRDLPEDTLDDAVASLEPKPLWPSRPRLSGSAKGVQMNPHHVRYHALRPSQFMARPPAQITQRPVVARMFDRTGGGYVELQVVDHSLEVEARIGPAWIETRFGELSIELDRQLPGTILADCAGRLVEEIIDHQSWRGRGWRIAAIAEEEYPLGERLIVATGSVDYRMPWAR